ncbi:two-component regulator propeller domain-containing protein, partial [Candidatus Venteria ishoeyi]|uniref:two-component regulator propeller domain-containing protein n=1 Tax=Candidatus Venteria ishoeyi TaxID=1899563 RepID=UPI00255CC85C
LVAFLLKIGYGKFFTNRDVINDFAIKDNGDTLLVATTGGIELRNANTGKLIRIITNLDGLPENNIRALQVDKNNGVWVATWAGLAYWKPNGVWLVFNTNNSRLVNNFITTLSLDLNP